MTALYALASEYRAAADALADLDLDPQTVDDTLQSLSGDLEEKSRNVAFVVRNIESLADAIKDAEHDMAMRRKALENRSARLRDYMLSCMSIAGVKKIEFPQFRISVRDNPPAVDVFDAAQLPTAFMRQPEPTPPSPDKSAIKEAIKSGIDVPGARLTRSLRLEIK